jgi:hypothetical protein
LFFGQGHIKRQAQRLILTLGPAFLQTGHPY